MISNKARRIICIFFASAMLAGCVLQSKQITAVIGMLNDSAMNLSENRWILNYSNYQSMVYAVTTGDGTLFSNRFGDHIIFDGWMIRKIQGINSNKLNISINQINGSRLFIRGTVVSSNHYCDKWNIRKELHTAHYFQNCNGNGGYENSITVDANGNITKIRQIVDERYTALTLTRLK